MRYSMRRLLLPVVLASVVTGCSGGGNTPAPGVAGPNFSSPVPLALEGPAKFYRHTVTSSLDSQVSFEGRVMWTEDVDAIVLQDPTSEITYEIASGKLVVTHRGSIGDCGIDGGTEITLARGNGSLVLKRDGSYSGFIKADAEFSTKLSCPGGNAKQPDSVFIELEIRGNLIDGHRMKGEMAPVTVASSEFKGSWDFNATTFFVP